MKKNIGHLMECIKSIYIGRLRAQLASSLSSISSHNGLSSHIRFFRNLRILSLLASAALIAIMTLAVFPIIRKASTAEATSLPSTTTLTMTTGSESADLSLLVSNASGTFSSSSSDELAKFSIATNNYTGYTLTISGSDDTGLLTNTDTTITTNNTFSSIDTILDTATFDNSIYNNKWGYIPSKYNSADNISFHPAPTTTASTLNVTNCANDTTNCPDTEDDYTIGLGIRADYTKPVGTYTNTFILTATANPVGYSITYADNTGDSTVADIPSVQAGTTPATSVVLNPGKTPTRTGYTFRAWCDGTVSSNGIVCTGTEYTAGSSIDFVNQTIATSSTTLYAVWDANTYSLTITFAGTGVSSVEVRTAAGTGGTLMGTVSSSGDTVDNLVYNTAYYLYPTFTSGNEFSSWTKTDTTSGASISSTTTANPTYTIGLGDGAVTITGKASCSSSVSGTMQEFNPSSLCSTVTSGTLTDSRDNQNYTVAKINNQWWMTRNLAIGCNGSGSTYGSDRATISLTSSDSNVSDTWSTGSAGALTSGNSYTEARMQCGSTYGAWYNYVAATAGTISGSSNSTNATKDICPSGWRLPTNSEQSGITSSVSAFSPVTGGYYLNGSLGGTENGGWWSATSYDVTNRHTMYYYMSSLNAGYDIRYLGIYVRCIKS